MPSTLLYAATAHFKKAAKPYQQTFQNMADLHKKFASIFAGTPIETGNYFFSACFETAARMLNQYNRPDFGIKEVNIGKKHYNIEEHIVDEKPFARLIHFKKVNDKGRDPVQKLPKLLLVAPLSGHFSTLLRNTVKDLLPDHDIYITDWKNAQNIPASEGKFNQEDYIEYLMDFIKTMGPNSHVFGVCQGATPALAATALLAAEDNPCQPLSLTLSGAPINATANISQPTQIALEKGMGFFRGLIGFVPSVYKGMGRRVYPGLIQLAAFMNMNLDTHTQAFSKHFENLTQGDEEAAEKHREFYDEYLAVLDMTEEFYLQTIEDNFIKRKLPNGKMTVKGKKVDPSKITKTALFTIEGGKDDISPVGQTVYAHRLCTNLPENMHRNVLDHNVGHYGTFNGSRFRKNIAPRITHLIRETGKKAGVKYSAVPANHTKPIKPRTWEAAQKEDYNTLLDAQGIAKEHFVYKNNKTHVPPARQTTAKRTPA